MSDESDFDLDMEDLSSAEDFLEYFEIEYEPKVVHVNRLHILQRFHDYINQIEAMPEDEEEKRKLYSGLLRGAYEDFVKSDAKTEAVLKIYKMQGPQTTFISLTDLKLS
jgi:nitrogenase-stabilizing/protective protein